MKTVPVADVEANFSLYLEQSQTEGPIVITENGKAVAVLLAPQDEEELERLVLGRSPRFQALLEQSRQSIRACKGLSRDAFWEAVERRQREKEQASQGYRAVTQDDVREWARAFHASLTGGAVKSLIEHLAASAQQVSNEHLRSALADVQSVLAQGNSLSAALAQHPDIFDKTFVIIVRYGELYGEVELTLQRFVERPEDMAPRCRRPEPA